MLKSWLVKLLTPVVVDVLKQDLSNEVFGVEELELKHKWKESNIYTIPEIHKIKMLNFSAVYFDPTCEAKVEINVSKCNFPEFKSALEKIKRSQPKHKYIKSCTFTMSYEHQMGEQRAYDFMVDSHTGYKSEAVKACAKHLLSWIDKHPEWLV